MTSRVSFIAVFCLLFALGCSGRQEEQPLETSAETSGTQCRDCKAGFRIKNYQLRRVEDSNESFKLTAEELSRRQRMGRILKFVDHDELYITGLNIDQALNSRIVKFDMRMLDPYVPVAEGLPVARQVNAGQPIEQTDAGGLANTLSRVLVDDFKIAFKPASGQSIVLTADHAAMLTDTQVIRLDGEVRVSAAKCKITADFALWSSLYNGLFLPASYRLNNKTYDKPAFYQISDTGKCRQLRSIGLVAYIDQLDAIEDKFLESMPEDIMLIFGMLGMPNQQNGIAGLNFNPDD